MTDNEVQLKTKKQRLLIRVNAVETLKEKVETETSLMKET